MNTSIKRTIDISTIEQFFSIEEDGSIWSKNKQKYLKGSYNSSGYLFVTLTIPKTHSDAPAKERTTMYAIHRLVACKYIGQCPNGKETSHKDGDKLNNHHTNLEYLTHAENILKSYRQHGRIQKNTHYRQLQPSFLTKQLMSNAKKKSVVMLLNGTKTTFPSIEDASQSLNTYRKKIYRCIYQNTPFTDKHNPNLVAELSFLV